MVPNQEMSETEQKVWVPPTAGFRGSESNEHSRGTVALGRDKVKLGDFRKKRQVEEDVLDPRQVYRSQTKARTPRKHCVTRSCMGF